MCSVFSVFIVTIVVFSLISFICVEITGLESGLFEYTSRGNILKSVKYPSLNITFMTAHASKGLGYDNVIQINFLSPYFIIKEMLKMFF